MQDPAPTLRPRPGAVAWAVMAYLWAAVWLFGGAALLAGSLATSLGWSVAVTIVAALGLTVLAWYAWAIGRLRARHRVVVPAPVPQVYDRLVTAVFGDRVGRPPPGVLADRHIEPLTPPPVRVGSRARHLITRGTRTGVWLYTVTAVTPDRELALLFSTPAWPVARFSRRYRLAPVPAGTQVTVDTQLLLTGRWWLVAPGLTRWFHGQARGNLAVLLGPDAPAGGTTAGPASG